MTELELVHKRLLAAVTVEEVFGMGSPAKTVFRQLAKVVHPDQNPGNPLSKAAFELLTQLYREAEDRAKEGTYGLNKTVWWKTPITIGAYEVSKFPISGSICDLYEGKDVFVKVARNHDDNDLLRAEREALGILTRVMPPVRDGIPVLRDSFSISGRFKRNANVINKMQGFLTLEEVKRRVKSDPRMLVWLFKRTLILLGWAHNLGVIHGAVLPPHIMVFPDNATPDRDARKHTIRLIDWCYSVGKDRTRLSALVPEYESFYAPEILDRKLTTSSDVYAAAKTIQFLGEVPDPLSKILERALDKTPSKRYKNTNEIFNEWVVAAEAAYGPPSWSKFEVPEEK